MDYIQPTLGDFNKKYKKETKQPLLKNLYRKTIKAVKGVSRLTLIGSLIFSGTFNTLREIKEERTTDNYIVDVNFGLGSAVVKNKDPRTAVEVYQDMLKTALNAKDVKEFYLNYKNKSIKERKAFITNFVKEVASSAGVRVEGVVFQDVIKQDNVFGMYLGANFLDISVTYNKIFIKNDLVKQPSFIKLIEALYHELVHAVENLNIKTNENVTNYNYKTGDARFNYATQVYKTTEQEIVANMLAMKFVVEFRNLYFPYERSDSEGYWEIRNSMQDILEEAVQNDIKLNARESKYYDALTVNDIFHIFLSNNYENKNEEYDRTEMENSYLYDILRYVLGNEIFSVNYKDFVKGYDNVNAWNLEEEAKILEEYLTYFNNEEYSKIFSYTSSSYNYDGDKKEYSERYLAGKMAKILGSICYDSNSYDEETLQKAYTMISENAYLLRQEVLEEHNLNSLLSRANIFESQNNEQENLNDELSR